MANASIAAATLGGLDLDRLPGPEALEVPGDSDGQTRVVRIGKKAFAYAWGKGKWEQVGEVVDGPGQQTGEGMSAGKQMLNGKEFDYVFDIEIEEGRVSAPSRTSLPHPTLPHPGSNKPPSSLQLCSGPGRAFR